MAPLSTGSLFLLYQVYASLFSVRWVIGVSRMSPVVKCLFGVQFFVIINDNSHTWLLKLKEAQNRQCCSKLWTECFVKLILGRFKLRLIDLCLCCPLGDTKVSKLLLSQLKGHEVKSSTPLFKKKKKKKNLMLLLEFSSLAHFSWSYYRMNLVKMSVTSC